MIIDSHAYCFPPGDAKAGYADARDHLRWMQAEHAVHHQPAWRVRDRAPASSEAIAPDAPGDWSTLPDVDFRVDRTHGRVVWTIDGEDYTKQFYPPHLRNLEYTPGDLIAEMDYAGVDVALLHTNPMLGRDGAFQAACASAFPGRLYSMAPVDEWRIAAETDRVIEEVERAARVHGLHAVKFNATLAYRGSGQPWSGGAYRPFWDALAALNVPVFFTLGAGPVLGYHADLTQGYLGELGVLMDWMDRYPDTVCSITHGFPWRMFTGGDRLVLPDGLWRPFENPNLSLEVCFPVRIGDLFDYPYREVWPALEEMVDRIGADRLLWGTDMPFQNRFCTYRQSRDWIEKYAGFLSEADLAAIMGGTAARILGIASTRKFT